MLDQAQKEKLDTLDGSRNRQALNRAAVRIEDLQGLLLLSDQLQVAKAAGAAPTAAEFDALVGDFQKIAEALKVVATALQSRLLV